MKAKFGLPSVNSSFMRLSELGYQQKEIIDVGAHKGDRSVVINKLYPQATIFRFEPIETYYNRLQILSEKFGNNSKAYNYLLSSKSYEVLKFYVNESVSLVLEEHYISSNVVVQDKTTSALDEVICLTSTNALLKIDVQDFELEVLKGAKNIIKNIECIQMEISLIDINKNAPLIHEVLRVMNKEYGFVLYDITEMIRRPIDKALWQLDVIFLKKIQKC